jgi:hypothetical protein
MILESMRFSNTDDILQSIPDYSYRQDIVVTLIVAKLVIY